MSDLSWLNPTPHAIAVYASQPLSPVATQHSLPSGRYSLTWAGLPPAGSHQLAAGALIQSPGECVGGISTSSGQPETGRLLNGHARRLRAPLFVDSTKAIAQTFLIDAR